MVCDLRPKLTQHVKTCVICHRIHYAARRRLKPSMVSRVIQIAQRGSGGSCHPLREVETHPAAITMRNERMPQCMDETPAGASMPFTIVARVFVQQSREHESTPELSRHLVSECGSVTPAK